MQADPWRQQFIALAQAAGRKRGQPAVAVIDDPDLPLVLSMELDGVGLEAIHFPQAHDTLVVHCRLGHVPQEDALGVLRRALLANQDLARSHAAMFGVDGRTGDLVYALTDSMADLSESDFLDDVAALADCARQWRMRLDARSHAWSGE